MIKTTHLHRDDECISALRLELADFTQLTPAEVMRFHRPVNAMRRAWIPQTLGEQIWCLFEFPSVDERIWWEQRLPEEIRNSLDRSLIELARPFGWEVRDMNGFPTTPILRSRFEL